MKNRTIFLALAFCVAGCGGSSQPKQITETRNIAPATSPAPGHGGAACPADAVNMPTAHPPISSYQWELPEGWVELPPTPIRVANFQASASPEVECYLTVLSGQAGGVAANVNRWHQQMGQPPLTQEDIETLPNLDMLGHLSPYVEISGDFTGMTGSMQSNYMMLAVVCPLAEETIFAKMTGPAEAVLSEKERFRTFCASLKEGGADTDATVEKDK